MNMYEELKAWADKWGVKYKSIENNDNHCHDISFDGYTYSDATFSYNTETGDYTWYGGD